MALERYVWGGQGHTWGGYCEYDRKTQTYSHVLDPRRGVAQSRNNSLSAVRLRDLIEEGFWKSAIPVDQRLPEGF